MRMVAASGAIRVMVTAPGLGMIFCTWARVVLEFSCSSWVVTSAPETAPPPSTPTTDSRATTVEDS